MMQIALKKLRAPFLAAALLASVAFGSLVVTPFRLGQAQAQSAVRALPDFTDLVSRFGHGF